MYERKGWSVCVCSCEGENIARRYQDVGFRGTPKGSSPFPGEFSLSSAPSFRAYVHAVSHPSSFFVFSFAGRSPTPSSSCTPVTCTFAPWRVSRDEEIRLAPRENGVIIYEGGKKETDVNHNEGEKRGRARPRWEFRHPPKRRFEKGFRKRVLLPRNQEITKS